NISAATLAQLTKSEKNLILALEPEAAALQCFRQELKFTDLKLQARMRLFSFFFFLFFCSCFQLITFVSHYAIILQDKTYMVVDCGGGTVDVCMHRVAEDGSLRATVYPSGGNWGSTAIDTAFLRLLDEVFGVGFME